MPTFCITIKGEMGGHLLEVWKDDKGLYYLIDPESPNRDEIHITAHSFQVRAAHLVAEALKNTTN